MSVAVLLNLVDNQWEIIDHPIDVPALAVNDLAAVRGDGIFETLLVQDGRVIKPHDHLQRLAISAQYLGLKLPPQEKLLEALIYAGEKFLADSPQIPEAILRLAVSRGRENHPQVHCYLMVSPTSPQVPSWRSDGICMITLNRGYTRDYARNSPWSLLGAKTLSYATNLAAGRYAQTQGAEDAIYLTSDGWVLEGTRGALVWRQGDTFYSTPHDDGILASTTQKALFATAQKQGFRSEYVSIRPTELYEAEAVWMISSITLATWIHTIDNTPTKKPSDQYVDQLWALLTESLGLTSTIFTTPT